MEQDETRPNNMNLRRPYIPETIGHRIEIAAMWLIFSTILFTLKSDIWSRHILFQSLSWITLIISALCCVVAVNESARTKFDVFLSNAMEVRSPAPLQSWLKFMLANLYTQLYVWAFRIILAYAIIELASRTGNSNVRLTFFWIAAILFLAIIFLPYRSLLRRLVITFLQLIRRLLQKIISIVFETILHTAIFLINVLVRLLDTGLILCIIFGYVLIIFVGICYFIYLLVFKTKRR